jgi:hypothetical protein
MGEMLGNLYLLLSCAFKNLAQDREVTINKVNKNMYTSINKKSVHVLRATVNGIVIIHQGREDIFLSRGRIKKRDLKLSSLPWCIYYFFRYVKTLSNIFLLLIKLFCPMRRSEFSFFNGCYEN